MWRKIHGREVQEVGKIKEEERKKKQALLVNVSGNIDKYTQNVLHNSRMGLKDMLYRKRKWRMTIIKSQLQENLHDCEVCKFYCKVNKDIK